MAISINVTNDGRKAVTAKQEEDRKARVSTALSADARANKRLEFAKSIHGKIYSTVLADIIKAVAPNAEPKFTDPEVDVRPLIRSGGGNAYCAHSSTRNFELSVEVHHTKNDLEVNANVKVHNPYSDKREVVLDAKTSESINPQSFAAEGTALAAKVCKGVAATIRAEVTEDMSVMKSTLASYKAQAKFLAQVIKAVQNMGVGNGTQGKGPQPPERPVKKRRTESSKLKRA